MRSRVGASRQPWGVASSTCASIDVASADQLVAPTVVRSQALARLYEAVRWGEISIADGIAGVTQINSLKVRSLGNKVLVETATDDGLRTP